VEKIDELQKLPEVGERERELAIALIKSMQGEFRPEDYPDSYRQAVMELIKQKAEGEAIQVPKAVEVEATVDLMKALEASLKVAKKEKTPL
jgi:DNA end-binding protein Ku